MQLLPWTNPFSSFLDNARAEIRKITAEPEVLDDPSLLPRFVQMYEDRNFVRDIVDRVEAMATALSRLRERAESYVRI